MLYICRLARCCSISAVRRRVPRVRRASAGGICKWILPRRVSALPICLLASSVTHLEISAPPAASASPSRAVEIEILISVDAADAHPASARGSYTLAVQ